MIAAKVIKPNLNILYKEIHFLYMYVSVYLSICIIIVMIRLKLT